MRDLFNAAKLEQRPSSAVALLRRMERREGLSADRRFATAYNAALELATITLYCKGYRPIGWGHHHTVFQAMKESMGADYADLADYFDACRIKRNVIDYDRAGGIS